MTVRSGREFLAIPGPTTIPDEVLRAMHRPAIDIYSGPLVQITDSILGDLRRLFHSKGHSYVYIANGHGAWEAALTNVLSRGDKVLVLESGHFAISWGHTAAKLGAEVEILPGDWRRAVRREDLENRLARDKAGAIKAILVAHVDTASGVVNDISAIGAAIKGLGHDALLMVDSVASLGCIPFDMDAWGVDVAVSASQKGLMTPAGLGFIMASDRAREVHKRASLRTPYWDWTAREGEAHYQKYAGTPPEQHLFGLRRALDMLFEEGLDRVYLRHRLLAESVRRAVAEWSKEAALEYNIVNPTERADTLTTIRLADGYDPQPILDYCNQKCGVVLGLGLGALAGKAFRIAHMGHVNAPMILGTLGSIEIAFRVLGIPHGGNGTQGAINWLAESVGR
jgi:alanine-glyoxylate transaminase / serine-glyoxylate transaminase / serine-pyruvate transaminase